MKGLIIVIVYSFSISSLFSQTTTQKLQNAWQQFESDEQLKHAISSLYVIDAVTGKVVFEKNSMIGLAPASTQKIITAATAFELLGKDYRYKTELSFLKDLHLGVEKYSITGSGDPTFGSTRYSSTIDTVIFEQFFNAFKTKSSSKNKIDILTINKRTNDIPDGWVWQDLGNYYGAYSSNLNWKENQYDLFLRSEKPGYPTEIVDVQPKISNVIFNNKVISGPDGSGDEAYIYFSLVRDTLLVKGSIPPYKKRFSISGSLTDPENLLLANLPLISLISKDIYQLKYLK
jgi:D-alanyl-D-alanine carboxypeptidase/D-alanyl-D-alanine-endopeptidase (penicillin-binding protein 4)